MIDYVLNSALWSVFGLVIGYACGSTARDIHEIKEAVVDEPKRSARFRRPDFPPNPLLGVAVLVLGLLTVLSTAVATHKTAEQNDCFRAYNVKFAEAFQARARAADSDRAALNTMLISIGNAKLTPKQKSAIYYGYLDQLKKGDQQRKAHPLPQPPNPVEACKHA